MMLLRFQNRTLVIADEVMSQTLEMAGRAAKSRSAVLLCGESGTGKELIARYIHEKSARAKASFVSVNCAAIPDGLMEAELFGYERGAFTGAIAQRIGKFERASGGTLLLDEISEMSVGLQAKLLRVLQEGEIDRIGGKDAITINTRVIATTNRDPVALVAEGEFREDLFYRLNVIRIECVPLRGRHEAILNLAEAFLGQSSLNQGREGMRLSPKAVDKLTSHGWPGNIRELQNAIERAVLLSDDKTLEPEHFDMLKSTPGKTSRETHLLSEIEQEHILQVLESSRGNRTEAAEKLGISIRTLRNKLNLYGES